jgi:tetratricopeptide (TPR) repeat protein
MPDKKSQLWSIAVFLGLFLILYFGCNTKSKDQKTLEKSRAQNLEIINIERIVNESKKTLSGYAAAELSALEDQFKNSVEDSTQINLLKSIASLWYSEKQALVSAHYAEQIALKLQNDADAWSICGTTYAIASKQVEDENEKKHAALKSRMAFENVLSIHPDNIDSKINLALSYVDYPDETNPMKGILMLVELNKQNPDNISVLLQLGRLSLGTNQLDKAVDRLLRVIELSPNNKEAHCLLAEVYKRSGEIEKASAEEEICNL